MADIKINDTLQQMYTGHPEGTRVAFQGDLSKAQQYYADFVAFVNAVAPIATGTNASLLDVGCGCGWSSYAFAGNHFKTTGMDLNANAFEPPPTTNLTFVEASILSIPFEAQSFDAVVSYQCLEHVPSPEAGLLELLRVCKVGGVICIVGPNILSPFLPLKWIIHSVIRKDVLWKRLPNTARHPYGNTIWENLMSIPITTVRLIRKLVSPNVTFTMRVPDIVPPFHGDNDACYLCNPTDLIKFFSKHGCQIIQIGCHGRPPLSYLFAGGTWIAARKLR